LIRIKKKYSQPELGLELERLSNILDRFREILDLIERDLINASCKNVGANGLAVETIFRCLLLKQQLRCSYEQLVFIYPTQQPTAPSLAYLIQYVLVDLAFNPLYVK
jgi:hypothetical protein